MMDASVNRPRRRTLAISAPSAQVREFRYRAFGLGLVSQIPLPELIPCAHVQTDLKIVRLPTSPDFPHPTAPTTYDFAPGRLELLWPAVGRFTIIGVDAVLVEPAPAADDRLLAYPLLGPVMALVKHLRGNLVLHASGIAVNGQGVGFLGDKQAGKSTLASAFIARGHDLLTDDVFAIAGLCGEHAEIEPAFPTVKLSPAAAALLSPETIEVWPQVVPGFPKRTCRLEQQKMGAGIPPRGLFVLVRGTQARIDPLAPAAVFETLMHNSYIKKYLARTLTPEAGARHLRQLGSLVRVCHVARLEVPDELPRLGEAVDCVIEYLRDIAGTAG